MNNINGLEPMSSFEWNSGKGVNSMAYAGNPCYRRISIIKGLAFAVATLAASAACAQTPEWHACDRGGLCDGYDRAGTPDPQDARDWQERHAEPQTRGERPGYSSSDEDR